MQLPVTANPTTVVTGGTGGIGLHTATTLARLDHRVLITGRNPSTGAEAIEHIRTKVPGADVQLLLGDLSVMSVVEVLAEKIGAITDRVDVLINNAGAINHDGRVTDDGLELAWAVNVAAPYRLTHALQSLLAAAPASRVVNVTGGAPFGGVKLGKLNDPSFLGLSSYTNTKRALEAISLYLADELRVQNTTVNVVYPGGASTPMTERMRRNDLPPSMRILWPVFRRQGRADGGHSALSASRSSVYAASSPDLEGQTGLYITTKSQRGKFHQSVTKWDAQRTIVSLVESVANGPSNRSRGPV